MTAVLTPLAAPYAELLARREAELRALLDIQVDADAAREVLDFKDMAIEETQATVEEAQADHAAEELGQVLAAMRRIEDGSYGECLDCGEPIDPRRLLAMPATAYCTACQARHEARRVTPPPAVAARP